jgi:hypothetical protein
MENKMIDSPNAQIVEFAIQNYNVVQYARVVGGYANASGNDYEYVIEKPWKWLDEIAQWLLETNAEYAKDLGLLADVTCDECYGVGDNGNELEHDSSCTK